MRAKRGRACVNALLYDSDSMLGTIFSMLLQKNYDGHRKALVLLVCASAAKPCQPDSTFRLRQTINFFAHFLRAATRTPEPLFGPSSTQCWKESRCSRLPGGAGPDLPPLRSCPRMCVGPSSRKSLVSREASHNIMIWHGLAGNDSGIGSGWRYIPELPTWLFEFRSAYSGHCPLLLHLFPSTLFVFPSLEALFFHRCSTIMRSVCNAIIRNKPLIAPHTHAHTHTHACVF